MERLDGNVNPNQERSLFFQQIKFEVFLCCVPRIRTH